MSMPTWAEWHEAYDDPASSLSRRLQRVQSRVRDALEAAPPGPIRVLSMCAGQGRDLLPVLAGHPRRADVRALLVELDPANSAAAQATARSTGLAEVRVRTGDASNTSAYAEIAPVDLALVCGVFGNIPDSDVRATVGCLPALLRPGGRVIWTRHRREPDLTPSIRQWFAGEGFTEVGFDVEAGYLYGVGTHLLTGPPRPFEPGVAIFRFFGDGGDAAF